MWFNKLGELHVSHETCAARAAPCGELQMSFLNVGKLGELRVSREARDELRERG